MSVHDLANGDRPTREALIIEMESFQDNDLFDFRAGEEPIRHRCYAVIETEGGMTPSGIKEFSLPDF